MRITVKESLLVVMKKEIFTKALIVFMIQGLKNSVPVVVKGCPIIAVNGWSMKWRVAFLPYPIQVLKFKR